MEKDLSRRAKVTPETKEESARLAQLWATREHPSQAEFGELYSIGNQSAVGQFLRGDVPLSLKAASGFAKGLGCRIEDFSPRLANEAAALVPAGHSITLPPEIAELAAAISSLPENLRGDVLTGIRNLLHLAQGAVAQANGSSGLSALPTDGNMKPEQRPAKRMKAG